MGIKHFFYWFKNRFPKQTYEIQKGKDLSSITDMNEEKISIDNLLMDLNGIFHDCAQKVFRYGDHAPRKSLLNPDKQIFVPNNKRNQRRLFEEICASIERIFLLMKPKKRLVLCVDGPAPIAKQDQQRQRRFRAASGREKNSKEFDSTAISPGTKMMDYLTKYIDWFIRKKVSSSPAWQKVQVIFSNEKAQGEGEHKLITFIRNYTGPSESFCIHGKDADLIMLALGTQKRHFYILREDMYSWRTNNEFFLVDIGKVRNELIKILRWTDEKRKNVFQPDSAINDFIFMCFTVGNDFLPHIPAIEIIEGGIEVLIDTYINVCEVYGHLTEIHTRGIRFRKKALRPFLKTLSHLEKGVLQEKLEHKDQFFTDSVLEASAKLTSDGTYSVDIKKYRENYYKSNLGYVSDEEQLCHDYLEGMQWVLYYYTSGVPYWRWRFTHHYAPFAHTLAKHVDTFTFALYPRSQPTVPFVQLLAILPPQSNNLVPYPLNTLLSKELSKYCPREFTVDLAGKRQEWEGLVILPFMDYSHLEDVYYAYIDKVSPQDLKRNILGKSFLYQHIKSGRPFKSYYGDFESRVRVSMIDLS